MKLSIIPALGLLVCLVGAAPPQAAPEVTDLLSGIDVGRDGVSGTWRKSGDGLVSPKEPYARLQIPGEYPAEYDLDLEVKREGAPQTLIIGLVSGKARFIVAIDGFDGTRSGIEQVDGKRFGANETTVVRTRPFLEAGRKTRVRCSVRKNRVTVLVDGTTAIDWKADFGRTGMRSVWSVPDSGALIIGAYNSVYRISSVRLTPVAGSPPAPPRPAVTNAPAAGAGSRPTAGSRGIVKTIFTERSPLSAPEEVSRRMGEDPVAVRREHPNLGRYDIAAESYQVYVPEGYTPEAEAGLMVYIHSTKNGSPSKEWLPIFDRFGIIWVGVNNGGNNRAVGERIGLAVDAVMNMQKRYAIDKDRIYVAGQSGGGKTASQAAFIYPDVFTGGGLFITLCRYFNPWESVINGQRKGTMKAMVPPPPKDILALMKARYRYSAVAPEKDPLRWVPTGIMKAMVRDKFAYAKLIEVPGMGHGRPHGPYTKWFEMAVEALEAPLADLAVSHYKAAKSLERSRKYERALPLYTRVARHARGKDLGKKAEEAAAAILKKRDERIAAAKRSAEKGNKRGAMFALKQICRDYGDLAGEATELLEQLKTSPKK